MFFRTSIKYCLVWRTTHAPDRVAISSQDVLATDEHTDVATIRAASHGAPPDRKLPIQRCSNYAYY
jgi:hypothetical protein